MNTPLVSVLLPAYQAEAYIAETIESVLAQSLKDWELVVANNASTDRTAEIVARFKDPRIRMITHSENLGVSKNWNFLLQLSQAKYACVLGADDIFEPGHLERKISLLEQTPDSPYIHGAVQKIDERGNQLSYDVFDCAPVEPRKVTLPRFLKVNFVNPSSVVFRMTVVRSHQLGFESRYPVMMDWALSLKLAMLGGPVVYDNQPTVYYRIHPKSVARATMNTFVWSYEITRLLVDALMEYPAIWREIGVDPRAEGRTLTKLLWRLAFQQARRGNFTDARRAWRFYREFHSLAEVFLDIPHYLGAGLKPTAAAIKNRKNNSGSV